MTIHAELNKAVQNSGIPVSSAIQSSISRIVNTTEEALRSAMSEMAFRRKRIHQLIGKRPVIETSVDLPFMKDQRLKTIVERDYAELQELDADKMPKSMLVLCGSILEGLLLDAIITSKYWTPKEANERFLKDMIHPAKAQGIIQHDNLSDVLRVFRNLVHPAREIRDNLVFDASHAKHAKTTVDVIIGEVRNWYASKTP